METFLPYFSPTYMFLYATFMENELPKPTIKLLWIDALNLFLWMSYYNIVQVVEYILFTFSSKPVYNDCSLILMFVKIACGIRREFENGWSAKSPMCDEYWTFCFHLCTRNGCRHVFHDSAHEMCDGVGG